MVKEGRFGPYVTDGETNASLRVADDPMTVSVERASDLLSERRVKDALDGGAPKQTTKRVVKKAGRQARRREEGIDREEDRRAGGREVAMSTAKDGVLHRLRGWRGRRQVDAGGTPRRVADRPRSRRRSHARAGRNARGGDHARPGPESEVRGPRCAGRSAPVRRGPRRACVAHRATGTRTRARRDLRSVHRFVRRLPGLWP